MFSRCIATKSISKCGEEISESEFISTITADAVVEEDGNQVWVHQDGCLVAFAWYA